MPEDPVVLLNGPAGRTFIETGLVVIRETRSRLFSRVSPSSDRDLLNNITLHHEWVHYLQSITCSAVHRAAQEVLRYSIDAVVAAANTGRVPQSIHEQITQWGERLYGRRSDTGVKVDEIAGGEFFTFIPESHQIGMLDILEGVAVLESFKLCIEDPTPERFLLFRDQYLPGNEKSVYHRSFNWLAHAIGGDRAV